MVSRDGSPTGCVWPCRGSRATESDSGARPVHRTRLARVAAEAVLEHEGQSLPFVAVMETQAIAVELRHDRSSKEPTAALVLIEQIGDEPMRGSDIILLHPVHDDRPLDSRPRPIARI